MTKVTILIREGVVQALYSNIDLQYIMVDHDEDSEEPILVGLPNTPDIVDGALQFQEALTYCELK